jgi:hypothetical protein
MERDRLLNEIDCMSRLLTAVKDCFIQKREVKDEIITLGSDILLENLRELKRMRQETDASIHDS